MYVVFAVDYSKADDGQALKFYELGLIESIQFLSDLGLISENISRNGRLEVDLTSTEALAFFSRFEREFVELSCIGNGAFGNVYMAQQ